MKFTNIRVHNFENAIRGMRNPKESWDKSDSYYGFEYYDSESILQRTNGQDYEILHVDGEIAEFTSIGPNDMKLAQALIKGGPEHRKFMRQIFVSVDITAPLYWWKEFDTYKVATVANSTSTMHKIHAKEFELEDFSYQKLQPRALECLKDTISELNYWRAKYNETKDKSDWEQMIELLPSSYNQRSTLDMNYETLKNIYHARKNHKMTEWHTFCDMIRELPYSEFITGEWDEVTE